MLLTEKILQIVQFWVNTRKSNMILAKTEHKENTEWMTKAHLKSDGYINSKQSLKLPKYSSLIND